jgi:hypothetical protein
MSVVSKIIILLILIKSNVGLSAEIGLKFRKIRGEFKGITFSDYMYFHLEVGGTPQIFYCMISVCAEWEKSQSDFQGKILELNIRSKEMYFRELKKFENIEEVLKLRVSETKKQSSNH